MSEASGSLEALEARLARLEGQRRLAGRAALAALLLGLFLVLTHVFQRITPPQTTLEAEAFVLRDWQGQVRARLEMAGGSRPELALFDPDGRARARVALADDGLPSIQVQDRAGRVRLALGVMPDDTPRLVLTGADGKPRAVLQVDGDDGGRVVVRDAAGGVLLEVP